MGAKGLILGVFFILMADIFILNYGLYTPLSFILCGGVVFKDVISMIKYFYWDPDHRLAANHKNILKTKIEENTNTIENVKKKLNILNENTKFNPKDIKKIYEAIGKNHNKEGGGKEIFLTLYKSNVGKLGLEFLKKQEHLLSPNNNKLRLN